MFDWALKKIFGSKHEREVRRLRPKVEAINALEESYKKLSDDALRAKTADFRTQLDNGASLDDLLVPAFASVREAGRRVLGMRHYDVQLIGGMVLHQGKIAEMKTGEGKTLVATLPCYLNALEGKGVHVVTVNDYLARRDAEWMGKLYGHLGMSTGIVAPGQRNDQKKRAYACDITYGQNNEIGFDYLRDNMKFSIHEYVQRDLHFAIVDEVDSILIDEARTPLIISGPGDSASEKYKHINALVPRLRRDEHYEVDEKAHSVTLTERGVEAAEQMLHELGLLHVEGAFRGSASVNLYDPVNLETLHILHQCLRAHSLYRRDVEYAVRDEKILIIDQSTGRILPGRRWSDGLHQAVEAKEHVPIQEETITLATISFQNLFRLYKKLSGMTGTADTEATEFHQIYSLDVVQIPTNRSVVRKDHDDLVYMTEKGKFVAVAQEIKEAHQKGQPVLVGTTSVEKSEALSRLLDREGVPHNVLNAKQHEREAYVVAQAGRIGMVTVATNMAGRGTDILLGGNPEMLAKMEVNDTAPPEVKQDPAAFDAALKEAEKRYAEICREEGKRVRELGGLRIVGTERHESRRIDNQLRGRAGRQGDPGESRFYLSIEDPLMRLFAGDRMQQTLRMLGAGDDMPIEHEMVTRAVENAQKKVEERNFDYRKNVLEFDDVMNEQRKSIYTLRRQVLCGQYRTVPTDAERKKGIQPKPLVTSVDEKLAAHVAPILEQMVKVHGAVEPPPFGASAEEIVAFRDRALATPIDRLGEIRTPALERDLYTWFGCVLDLRKVAKDPQKLLEQVKHEVGMSLTEQQERMLELVDEMVGELVEKHCPPQKHWEDWDVPGLAAAFEKQFVMKAGDFGKVFDAELIAKKLFQDSENVLARKEKELGAENFLRLFRNFYLQEIDRQWIEHLQSMEHLRDGIYLRSFGQKDPKKEFKREGYDLFRIMITNVKSSVTKALFTVERAREEDLERLEAERRAQIEKREHDEHTNFEDDDAQLVAAAEQAARAAAAAHAQQAIRAAAQQAMQAGRASAPAPQRASVSGPAAAAAPAPQVKREGPKLGRNDPCHCGSGKKYKNCHYREDQDLASNR
ncbi:MAG: preprotein translocase subunit SecA [Polyangiales bacterium]